MIEIFMFNKMWRVKITNETLEFKDSKDLTKALDALIKLKEEKAPYK